MKNTFFKHMKREHYYSLLEAGEVLVSNLYSYRNHQNKEIKDEGEAKSVKELDTIGESEFLFKSATDVEFKKVSEHPEHKPLIQISNFSFLQRASLPDVFCYCVSKDDSDELFKDYDCCIEINDDKFFALIGDELFQKGFVKKVSSKEGIVTNGIQNDIVYSTKKEKEFKKDVSVYFSKDLKYKRENEFRAIYFPIDDTNDLSPIVLKIPRLKTYFSLKWKNWD
jgi:hypothetical protein